VEDGNNGRREKITRRSKVDTQLANLQVFFAFAVPWVMIYLFVSQKQGES